MGKCRYLLDQQALLILYYSLILPYLSYCTEIWGNTYSSHLETVFKLQKKAIRIVHNVDFRDHTNTLFIKSNLLKLEDLIKLKVLLIVFKARANQLPSNIQQLFTNREGGYNLRGTLHFKVQCVRTTLRSQCVTRRGVNLWNDLKDELKSAVNLHQFKKQYKISILTQYVKCNH